MNIFEYKDALESVGLTRYEAKMLSEEEQRLDHIMAIIDNEVFGPEFRYSSAEFGFRLRSEYITAKQRLAFLRAENAYRAANSAEAFEARFEAWYWITVLDCLQGVQIEHDVPQEVQTSGVL